jgi:hypothetical protein
MFTTTQFDARMAANLSEEAKKCCICLSDFEHGDDVRFLACLHRFHVHCIDRWLSTSTKCPLCKKDLKQLLEQMKAIGGGGA